MRRSELQTLAEQEGWVVAEANGTIVFAKAGRHFEVTVGTDSQIFSLYVDGRYYGIYEQLDQQIRKTIDRG